MRIEWNSLWYSCFSDSDISVEYLLMNNKTIQNGQWGGFGLWAIICQLLSNGIELWVCRTHNNSSSLVNGHCFMPSKRSNKLFYLYWLKKNYLGLVIEAGERNNLPSKPKSFKSLIAFTSIVVNATFSLIALQLTNNLA